MITPSGIGVDDMFVICTSLDNVNEHKNWARSVEDRIALAMKHAGVAITITSLTDVIVFALGATSV